MVADSELDFAKDGVVAEDEGSDSANGAWARATRWRGFGETYGIPSNDVLQFHQHCPAATPKLPVITHEERAFHY